MSTPLSLGDVLDFCLANKSNKVFIGMTPEQIGTSIVKGAKAGTLLTTVDNSGKISGIIIAEVLEGNDKVLWVRHNLAMNLANLITFAKIAKERMPEYKLQWQKNGAIKRPDTTRLYDKLLSS